ncbi:MAG: type II toxin-antitoxin system VapB family antitoxin [Sphingomonas sp.]|nr:type II toxin-antitoxin system VapB family antitoxin [Sphingomonas sp.]
MEKVTLDLDEIDPALLAEARRLMRTDSDEATIEQALRELIEQRRGKRSGGRAPHSDR